MSADQARCEEAGSTETAATLVSRAANSSRSRATAPSSVVHTGVKSAGCESSTPQESPSHSWKRISPSAVWAVKSGARSPRFKLTAPAGAGGATGRAERSGNRDEVDVDTGAKAHISGSLPAVPGGRPWWMSGRGRGEDSGRSGAKAPPREVERTYGL